MRCRARVHTEIILTRPEDSPATVWPWKPYAHSDQSHLHYSKAVSLGAVLNRIRCAEPLKKGLEGAGAKC